MTVDESEEETVGERVVVVHQPSESVGASAVIRNSPNDSAPSGPLLFAESNDGAPGDDELRRTLVELRHVYEIVEQGLVDLESLLHNPRTGRQEQGVHRPFNIRPLYHSQRQAQLHEPELIVADNADSREHRGSNRDDSNKDSSESDETSGREDDDDDDASSRESLSNAESNGGENDGNIDEPSDSEDEANQGGNDEQEAYRRLLVDKEVFHLLHKIHANDPTATSLSLLPEADRVLMGCDWDASTLLNHKRNTHGVLSRRELLNHVSRQMQSRQPQLGIPTGATLFQQALARPPLFLQELQVYYPLIATFLDTRGREVLGNFLATSSCLRQLSIFHTSSRRSRFDNENPRQQDVLPNLIDAVSRSPGVQNLAFRKLSLPSDADFSSMLAETKSLVELDLSYCSIDSSVCQSLKTCLAKNKTLRKFCLRKDLNDFESSLVPIFEGLTNDKILQELEIENMTCQQAELTALAQCVASTSRLEYLSLIVSISANPSGTNQEQAHTQSSQEPVTNPELNASSFFQAIAANKSLRNLRLHSYVTMKDEEAAWRVLLGDSGVETLDLGQGLLRQSNPVLVAGVRESMLQPKHSIINLNLSNVYCHGELSFSRALSNCDQPLEKLFLRNCRLMDSDCEDIANGLQNSDRSCLSHLDLGSNYVGFHGLSCLARSLAQNPGALESLDLSFNNFGHYSSVKSFALLLKSAKLKYLYVSCTDMFVQHSEGIENHDIDLVAEALRASLAANAGLERLVADDNGFSDALSIAFFTGLRDNTYLKEVSLDGNSLRLESPECRQSVVQMLSKNKTLIVLNMPRNRGMTEAGFRALSRGIKKNTTLKQVAVRIMSTKALAKFEGAIISSHALVKLTVALPPVADRVDAESQIASLLKCVGKLKTFEELDISNAEQHLISPSTGKILLSILRKNFSFHLFNLSLALCPFEIRVLIEFFVQLNRRGRRLLDASRQEPVGLWPLILSRLTRPHSGCAPYLYYFLREHVAVYQQPN
ncbi:hypothetical protein ACA910_004887 [Epithemia clementina (nom. ined.)]